EIVLGYPYYNSLYWLFSSENQHFSDKSSHEGIKGKYNGGHPYYRTLYGKEPGKYVDETISYCLLYDKIYISPADEYLPDNQRMTKGQLYYNRESGVTTSWDWTKDVFSNHELTNEILKSSQVIQNLLKTIPDVHSKHLV